MEDTLFLEDNMLLSGLLLFVQKKVLPLLNTLMVLLLEGNFKNTLKKDNNNNYDK